MKPKNSVIWEAETQNNVKAQWAKLLTPLSVNNANLMVLAELTNVGSG